MSHLFSELYIDEDVSALLTKLLRSRGFVVTSTQEAGMLGCSDEEQLAHAASQRKALSLTIEFTSKRSSSNTTQPVVITAA